MSKYKISKYFDSVSFRDFRFKDSRFFGKVSIARSINLLDPDQCDLEDALETFTKDGYGSIVVYITQK